MRTGSRSGGGDGPGTDLRGEEGAGAEVEPDEHVRHDASHRDLAEVAFAGPALHIEHGVIT